MLEYLRNASNKPVAKILMGLLIFSFVGWGVADWIFGASMRDSIVAQVGSDSISVQQFSVEKSRAMARLSKEQQKQIYTDATVANAFNNQILADLIKYKMVESHARDLGFIVSDKRVAAEIRDFSEFQDQGQFSVNKFYAVLMNSGFTEDQFGEYLRSQILRSYTLGAMSMPIAIPEFAIKAAYNARYGERAIEYSTVKFSDFKVGEPTTEQLREFYAQNPKMVPETRSASYVLITAQMDKPDTYEAGYKKAQSVEDAIISGDSMEKAAKEHGAKFVALPTFSKDKRPVDALLTDSMLAKMFAMDMGMESELIETKQGFVIIRVDNVKPSHSAEFESVKNNLTADWKQEEQKKQAYIAANAKLVDVNKGEKMSGKTATVSRMSGAPTDVLVAAFKQTVGKNALVPGSDAFYVLRVDKEIMPKMDTAKTAGMRKELQTMTMRQVMDDYNAFLSREYPVKINHKMWDKLLAH